MRQFPNLFFMEDLRNDFQKFIGTDWEMSVKRLDLVIGSAKDEKGISRALESLETLINKMQAEKETLYTKQEYHNALNVKYLQDTLYALQDKLRDWKNRLWEMTYGAGIKDLKSGELVKILAYDEYFVKSRKLARLQQFDRSNIKFYEEALEEHAEASQGHANGFPHGCEESMTKFLYLIEATIGEKLTDDNIKQNMVIIVDIMKTKLGVCDVEGIRKLTYGIVSRIREINDTIGHESSYSNEMSI